MLLLLLMLLHPHLLHLKLLVAQLFLLQLMLVQLLLLLLVQALRRQLGSDLLLLQLLRRKLSRRHRNLRLEQVLNASRTDHALLGHLRALDNAAHGHGSRVGLDLDNTGQRIWWNRLVGQLGHRDLVGILREHSSQTFLQAGGLINPRS